MTRDQLRGRFNARLKRDGLSIRAFAKAHGIHFGHVADFLRGDRPPFPSVLAAFGYRKRDDDYVKIRKS